MMTDECLLKCVCLLFILFYGEPDIHDAIINLLGLKP